MRVWHFAQQWALQLQLGVGRTDHAPHNPRREQPVRVAPNAGTVAPICAGTSACQVVHNAHLGALAAASIHTLAVTAADRGFSPVSITEIPQVIGGVGCC